MLVKFDISKYRSVSKIYNAREVVSWTSVTKHCLGNSQVRNELQIASWCSSHIQQLQLQTQQQNRGGALMSSISDEVHNCGSGG